jgi:hypothetical protein
MPLSPTRTLRIPSRYANSFDGVDDYVEIPHSPTLEIQDEMTFEFWIYPKPQKNNWARILEKGGWQSGGWSIQQDSVGARRINFYFGSSSGWSGGFAPSVGYPSDNQWYHIVAVVKLGVFGRTYLNGSLLGTLTPATYYPTSAKKVTIGGPGYFNGLIDEVRIYNRVLSASEISWNYQNFYNPVRDGLVLCLIADPQYVKDIDGDGILEWIDLSGYNNTGKIYGATLVDLFKSPARTLPAARTMPVAR